MSITLPCSKTNLKNYFLMLPGLQNIWWQFKVSLRIVFYIHNFNKVLVFPPPPHHLKSSFLNLNPKKPIVHMAVQKTRKHDTTRSTASSDVPRLEKMKEDKNQTRSLLQRKTTEKSLCLKPNTCQEGQHLWIHWYFSKKKNIKPLNMCRRRWNYKLRLIESPNQ